MKIKILQIEEKSWNYCHSCEQDPLSTIHGITQWDEVTFEELSKLREAVRYANQNPKNQKGLYFIVEQIEDYQEVFDSAKEFIEYNNKQQEKLKKQEEERKVKLAENKAAREVKQLENLKKKLKELESRKS